MKNLTFHGEGLLEVPGFCLLKQGQSEELPDEIADAVVRANPGLQVTVSPVHKRRSTSQPEAHEGEGQPTASTNEKE